MSQLNTFRVSGRTRGITKYGAVILAALVKGNIWVLGTAVHHLLETVDCDTDSFACLFILRCDGVKANKILYRLSGTIFLHRAHLLYVVRAREHTNELGLLQNIINRLNAHRVEKTDRGVVEIHVGDVCCEPLPSVFRPKTNKFPLFTITFSLVGKTKFNHASTEVPSNCLNLSIRKPLILTIACHLSVFKNLCPRTQVRNIGSLLCMPLKVVQKRE